MCHLFRCLGAHEVLTCSSCRPVFAVVPYFTPVFPQTPMLSPFPPTIGVWGEPGDHPRVSPSVYHTYTVSTLSRTPCLVVSCILSPPLPPQGREPPSAVLPDRSSTRSPSQAQAQAQAQADGIPKYNTQRAPTCFDKLVIPLHVARTHLPAL